MLIVLTATAGTRRKSNIPHIGVHLIAISNGRHHVYTTKLSQVPIPGHYLRVYIWIGEAWALWNKDIKSIAKFLYEDVICQ